MNTLRDSKREARDALRGVEVRLVDVAPLEALATEQAREHMPDRVGPNTTLRVGFAPWGVFTAADGSTILVCNEGVGYVATDDDATTCSVEFYTDRAEDGQKFVSMMPVASMTLTVGELAHMETGETVDLVDHVRTFGQRLESNVDAMYRLATDEAYAAQAVAEQLTE